MALMAVAKEVMARDRARAALAQVQSGAAIASEGLEVGEMAAGVVFSSEPWAVTLAVTSRVGLCHASSGLKYDTAGQSPVLAGERRTTPRATCDRC